jgi:hypothetical protein
MLIILTKKAKFYKLTEKIIQIKGDASSSGLESESMELFVSFSLFHKLSQPQLVLDGQGT